LVSVFVNKRHDQSHHIISANVSLGFQTCCQLFWQTQSRNFLWHKQII